MTDHSAPFPDELLTSWFARRNHRQPGRAAPVPVAVLDRKGEWRHPDVRPTQNWLRDAAQRFDVAETDLSERAIAWRRPALPLGFLAWDCPPFRTSAPDHWPPKLHVSWCSQCLADDYASGRPAYIRRHWVIAATGFCHEHHWPLEDQCIECHGLAWKFVASARGPMRMVCEACWTHLDRSLPPALAADQHSQDCWGRVIEFEEQLLGALQGRRPEQRRFPETSAAQLLNEVRDVCRLLLHNHPDYPRPDSPLGNFSCPAMTFGRRRPEFWTSDAPFPLATARMSLRRCLLAAVAAIIDPCLETGRMLFGPLAPPAAETFVNYADDTMLQRYLTSAGRWSASLVRRIGTVRSQRLCRIALAAHERTTSRRGSPFATSPAI
jgi:hypothetical protein